MTAPQEIKIGQHWQWVDPRYPDAPAVEVVAIGKPYLRPRTKRRPAGKGMDISIRNTVTGRTTTASYDRFHGKRGGYRLLQEAANG